MNVPDIDPEDKLLFPEGTEPTVNLFKNIPGGPVTLSILVLTALASFGLGMLAEHSIDSQKTGLTGSAVNSPAAQGSDMLDSGSSNSPLNSAVNGPNTINTAVPASSASN